MQDVNNNDGHQQQREQIALPIAKADEETDTSEDITEIIKTLRRFIWGDVNYH